MAIAPSYWVEEGVEVVEEPVVQMPTAEEVVVMMKLLNLECCNLQSTCCCTKLSGLWERRAEYPVISCLPVVVAVGLVGYTESCKDQIAGLPVGVDVLKRTDDE